MPAPDWYHPIDYADLLALRRVSLHARAVFLEMFGTELGTKTGLVEVRPNLIAAESEGVLTKDAVDDAIRELSAKGIIVWSAEQRFAYHAGHLIRHGATNPKHAVGWRTQLAGMPVCSARDAALSELDGIAYRKGTDSLSEGYRLGKQQEQEQEQEQNRNRTSTPAPAAPAPSGLLVDVPVVAKKATTDHAAQLHAWYEEHCPTMPKCRFKPGSAAHTAALKAWKREPDAELWQERFKRAGASDTLCNGFKDWKGADFIFLLGPQNAAKLDAGTYDNRTPLAQPEWERLGFKSEQAYTNNKAYHAQQEAARIAKEQREQEAKRTKFAAASVPFDDAEAEYRKNNPLPVWAFPAEPPTDDEDLPL